MPHIRRIPYKKIRSSCEQTNRATIRDTGNVSEKEREQEPWIKRLISYDHNSKIASTFSVCFISLLRRKLCDRLTVNEVGPKPCCNCMIFNISPVFGYMRIVQHLPKLYLPDYIIGRCVCVCVRCGVVCVCVCCVHDESFRLSLSGHGQYYIIIYFFRCFFGDYWPFNIYMFQCFLSFYLFYCHIPFYSSAITCIVLTQHYAIFCSHCRHCHRTDQSIVNKSSEIRNVSCFCFGCCFPSRPKFFSTGKNHGHHFGYLRIESFWKLALWLLLTSH